MSSKSLKITSVSRCGLGKSLSFKISLHESTRFYPGILLEIFVKKLITLRENSQIIQNTKSSLSYKKLIVIHIRTACAKSLESRETMSCMWGKDA